MNGALAWAMLRQAREHRSMALEADARHLFTDVWTSAGVLVGLLAVQFNGWLWFDPVIVIVILVAANRFVDLHMPMPAGWTLGRAASLRGTVEQALMAAVPGLGASIQLLPMDVAAHFNDERDPL